MILLDTTPLVALCDPRDALHRRALDDLDRVGSRAIRVCEAVVTEACFLLPHPVHRERLRRLIAELPLRSLESHGDATWEAVFDWLAKYGEHDPDWADGYLITIASRARGAKVWTYDNEFATTWRDLDGKRVPLLVDPRAA